MVAFPYLCGFLVGFPGEMHEVEARSFSTVERYHQPKRPYPFRNPLPQYHFKHARIKTWYREWYRAVVWKVHRSRCQETIDHMIASP